MSKLIIGPYDPYMNLLRYALEVAPIDILFIQQNFIITVRSSAKFSISRHWQ